MNTSNPNRTSFPNLAGAPSEETDTQVLHELTDAGIKAVGPMECRGEVQSAYLGSHCRWIFKRAWYYWVAEGPGIPPDKAQDFHNQWGTQVRVEGHCGCPSPLEYNQGFAIGYYHIDTQEGLNAFAKLLKSIYIPNV